MNVFLLFIVGILAGALSWALTPLTSKLAVRVGAVDRPGPRKIHKGAIPRLGGLAVILAVASTWSLMTLFARALEFARPDPGMLLAIAVGALPVMFASFVDDLRPLRPWLKLGAQLLSASVVVLLGLSLGPQVHLFGAPIDLGWLAIPITILWIVGVTNAFNIIDGLDGLSAGLAVVSAFCLVAIALVSGDWAKAALAAAMVGALVGFLPYNTFPARVFLGDCGAATTGFLLACLALPGGMTLSSGMAVLLPILAMGVPLADTLLSILRRAIRRASTGDAHIFDADADHIHHRLVGLGLDHRRAVLVLYGVGIAGAAIGIGSLFVTNSNAGLLLGTLLVAAMIGVGRLGYDEFGMLRRGVVLRIYDAPVLRLGLFRVFVDMVLVAAAMYLAISLKYEDWELSVYGSTFLDYLSFLLPMTVLVFWGAKLYERSWRFASLEDAIGATAATLVSTATGFILIRLTVASEASPTLFVTFFIVFLALVGTARSSFRVLDYLRGRTPKPEASLAAIYGAGDHGLMAARELQLNERLGLVVVGFIDDDPNRVGRRVGGYPVLGDAGDVDRLFRDGKVKVLVVASDQIHPERLRRAFLAAEAHDCDVLRFSLELHSIRVSRARAAELGVFAENV